MAASPTRRQKRYAERSAKKLYEKISRQTIERINQQSPEEREKLLLLYNEMLRQKQEVKQNKENN
jgi:hypothetical protein